MIYPFIDPGYDPTPNPSTPSNSLLYQMVNEAKPASTTGMIIWSQTAPNIISYPDLLRCLWGKLNSSNVRTGEFYWCDGANWKPFILQDGSLTGAVFADQSIGVEKLTPGGSLQIPRTSAIPTDGVEWVDASDLFGANSFPLVSLTNASGPGYFLYSGVGGVWSAQEFSVVWYNQLTGTEVPISLLTDVASAYASGQVPYFPATGGHLTPGWADQLLRANSVATSKLSLGLALAGKTPRVNPTGTDFEYYNPNSVSTAILIYQVSAGVAGQLIPATTDTQVQWNSSQDPVGILTLAANRITFAEVGTYLIDFTTPVYPNTAGVSQGHIMLYNVTAATVVAADVFVCGNGNGWPDRPRLLYQLIVSDITTVYEFRVRSTLQTYLMSSQISVNQMYPNRYQQVMITKIA